MFSFFVYPCCLKAWYKSKLRSKVVFIILILSPTTVWKISLMFYKDFLLVISPLICKMHKSNWNWQKKYCFVFHLYYFCFSIKHFCSDSKTERILPWKYYGEFRVSVRSRKELHKCKIRCINSPSFNECIYRFIM